MKHLAQRLERITEYFMVLALVILVLSVFSNVVLRYIFNTGIPAAEEVARLMFVWITFLGAILALRRHALLGVELIQARLPRWARRGSAVISHVLMMYALWLFFAGSWTQTVIGMGTYSTVMGYPTALMASSGLVCSGSMMVIVAVNLWRILVNSPDAMVPGEIADPFAPPAHVVEEGAAS
jgi:TRAP-type C4-dicarboxylate transport system permease small subunit